MPPVGNHFPSGAHAAFYLCVGAPSTAARPAGPVPPGGEVEAVAAQRHHLGPGSGKRLESTLPATTLPPCYARIDERPVAIAVAAMRERLGVAGAEELSLALDSPLTAPEVAELTHARLGGLVLDALTRHGLEGALPEQSVAELRALALRTVAAESVRLRVLARAVAALEAAGFQIFAIKGAALSALVPEHMALRPSTDLDLWVPGAAATAANRVLIDCGFPLDDEVTPEDPRKWHCQPLRSPEGIMIELHRRPWHCRRGCETGPQAPDRIAHPLVPGGIPVPGVEEMIVIAAVHAALNRATPGHLMTLWDIGALAGLRAVDWEQVADLSRRLEVLRGVRAVLSRAALLGLADPPAELRLPPVAEARVRLTLAANQERGSALLKMWQRREVADTLSNWLGCAAVSLPPAPPLDRRLPGLVVRRIGRGAREVMAAIRGVPPPSVEKRRPRDA